MKTLHKNYIAFSLVELLVVIAIVAVLAALAAPAIRGMSTSQTLGSAADEIAALFEIARAEAVMRSAPVWVGFATRVQAGNPEVLVASVVSRDGSFPTSPANLDPLGRALVFRNLALDSLPALRSESTALIEPARRSLWADIAGSTNGANFTVSGQTYTNTITFTPQGDVLLKGEPLPTDGFDSVIGLVLRETRGTVSPPNAQELALGIDGATGLTTLYRIR